MADNFDFTPGSGKTRASDDIGGLHFERTKLVHGADGTNDGDVSKTNGYPVAGAQAEYETLVEITTITSSYQSCALSNVSTSRVLRVENGTDIDIRLSWNAGSNLHHVIPSGCERIIPIKIGATQLHQRDDGTTYGAGKLRIEVIR